MTPVSRGRESQTATARSTIGMMNTGTIPMATQQAANTAIGPSIFVPGSWADSAAWVRGDPVNTMPISLMNVLIAKAPIIASAGAASAPRGRFFPRQG